MTTTSRDTHRGFIPDYLLRRIAGDEGEPGAAARTLLIDDRVRARRRELRGAAVPAAVAVARGDGGFTIHTADNTDRLPGDPVRDQDQPAAGDKAVDEAWDGVRAAVSLFAEVFARESYDGAGTRVSATVHYEKDYNNAFWDGEQLVFGDGDGRLFGRFTKPLDVCVHEFAHGVVEHTSGLVYQGQSGALNESVADCFAACAKQRVAGEDAADGDWLIGEGIFAKGVKGKALRSMTEPGTAYDDPRLGKDPQPAHMDDYISTDDDNGGVHLNSGIPNRAFALAAVAIGGTAAEGAGTIWYAALQAVAADVDFAGFAAATVAAAGDHADTVRKAWEQVGVTPGAEQPTGEPSGGPSQLPTDPPRGPSTRVAVTRSGGFAGITTTSAIDLAADDDEDVAEVRRLLGRTDLRGARKGEQRPDMFSYTFEVDDQPPVTLIQTDLDDDLRRVADLVLRRSDDSSA